MFYLSKRSKHNLIGIKPRLASLVKQAIKITKIDFAVIEGLRTAERQALLFKKGVTQVRHSKHQDGNAVDLMAYVESRSCWEIPPYFHVAEAMMAMSKSHGVRIRWGGAWQCSNLMICEKRPQELHEEYLEKCSKDERRPFIDAPHFELI